MPETNVDTRPFRERKSLAARIEEVQGIRRKFPNKLPVIVERYHKEKNLPCLDKTKFLVPREISMSQFVAIIRNRMMLNQSQAFYLLIDDKGIASMSMTMAEIYERKKSNDGFLYMSYASQEMFGN
ncbi:microtubule-associated s 1A 1B light chain 3C [Brachionus plicatilis]|uniref:Microtubule associated protein 1 light chain 3C-like protein n=1 Tax=Brachionus plicatilis TaxID=10195 RepID=A0A2Z4EUK1_BRAPC|nr:microtubule associated protein 1 light chain 3C-like protein [Brachionus plicatilis]RNA33954.1 microtubule-associated s 1A 1B light chain 3C [Brachionus plicatilis]